MNAVPAAVQVAVVILTIGVANSIRGGNAMLLLVQRHLPYSCSSVKSIANKNASIFRHLLSNIFLPTNMSRFVITEYD